MLCKFWAVTRHFIFQCEMKFSMELVSIGEKLLPTKAAFIASHNLSIFHWSLNKNMTQGQISMFQINFQLNPVQSSMS